MKRVVHDCSMTQTNRLHTVIYRQTVRQKDIQQDIQTARQKDIQQDIQTARSTKRHTAGYTDGSIDKKTYSRIYRQTDDSTKRHRSGYTDRQTDRQKNQ